MEIIIDKIFGIVSLEYMVSVVLASYLLIKCIDTLNGDIPLPSWSKRCITCVTGVALFIVFKEYTEITVQCLVTSFFMAVFLYDTLVKMLLERAQIGYKK